MKKLAALMSTLVSTLAIAACAQEAAEKPKEPSLWDFHPIHIGGNALAIGKASVQDPDQGDVLYNKYNAFVYGLVPISRTSYFFPRVEWNGFTFDWNQNPYFNATHFSYYKFALTFFSIGLENWRWIARLEYSINHNFAHPGRYGLYNYLLWGTHEIHRKWHYHVGVLGYKGMEGGELYPIIGADYKPSKSWTIQLVFPIDYSVQYHLNPNWTFSLKGRPLKERFRVGPNEPQPRSVFNYSSFGAEFNVQFEKKLQFEIEAYIGYNTGGSFYIKDQYGYNAIYRDLGGAPYGGISLNWGL